MGFGCNAVGVCGCRIISSERERLIAIVTNSFMPCNGRFPLLFLCAAVVMSGVPGGGWMSALLVLAVIFAGVFWTLVCSRLLSRTVLRGVPSAFALELPPFRMPKIGQVIVRSLFERTLKILGRAVIVSAPAGLVLWLMSNISVGGFSLLTITADWLEPFGRLLGLDGAILLAFILALPANELVLPVLLMAYLSVGALTEPGGMGAISGILAAHSWTWLTALNVMLLSTLHYPCATTLWTIKKESGGVRWAVLAAVLPTAAGMLTCLVTAAAARAFGLV